MSFKKSILGLAIISLSITWLAGCKKVETVVIEKEIINITTPVSLFKVGIYDRRFAGRVEKSINIIDSNFYFKNLSDSSENITYRWDFGDGAISNLRHPKHSYSESGTYVVKLVVSKAEKAFDTTQTQLKVIAGQREFEWDKQSVSAIDIVEKSDGGFMFLGSSSERNVFPTTNITFLMELDKDLRQKSLKILPANVSLYSIAPCFDGTYICTGNIKGTSDRNELINISADGTILWSKVIGDGYLVNAQQLADHSFILTGSKGVPIDNSGNLYPRTVIIKTNGNGNTTWSRLFSNGLVLKNSYNIVEEDNGFTFAGIKVKTPSNYYCEACDSVCLIKLNSSGQVIKYNSIQAALNVSNFGNTNLGKGKTGNYIITPGNTKGIFIFSPQGEFTDRKLMTYPSTSTCIDNNGDIIALQEEWGNGFRSVFSSYNETGTPKWLGYLDGAQYLPQGGYGCCADSWPVTVKKLKDGGAIFLSIKVDMNDYHYIAALVKVDANGNSL